MIDRNSQQEDHQVTNPNGTNDIKDEECSICLSDLRWCCATQCGHRFCTECIVTYWRSGGGNLICPYCRAPVTLLIPEYHNIHGADEAIKSERLHDIDSFNAMQGSERAENMVERITNTPRLLRAMAAFYSEDPLRHGLLLARAVLSLRRMLFILVAIFYILSPLDLIPEALFGIFGMIDDIMVFMGMFVLVAGVFRGILVQRAYQNQ